MTKPANHVTHVAARTANVQNGCNNMNGMHAMALPASWNKDAAFGATNTTKSPNVREMAGFEFGHTVKIRWLLTIWNRAHQLDAFAQHQLNQNKHSLQFRLFSASVGISSQFKPSSPILSWPESPRKTNCQLISQLPCMSRDQSESISFVDSSSSTSTWISNTTSRETIT